MTTVQVISPIATRNAPITFLGDITKFYALTLKDNEAVTVASTGWLQTSAADYLLQRFCVDDIIGNLPDQVVYPTCSISSVVTELLKKVKVKYDKNNKPYTEKSARQRFEKTWSMQKFSKLGNYFQGSHFLTIIIHIDPSTQSIFSNVKIYDSARPVGTRSNKTIPANSRPGIILCGIQKFLAAYVYPSDLDITKKINSE